MIKQVHCSVNALQTEGRDNFRRHLESLVNLFLLLVCQFAEHEVDLRSARVRVSYTKSHACVRVSTQDGLDVSKTVMTTVRSLFANTDCSEG